MTSKDWLLSHLPHQGAMNLLDRVASWDQESIHCLASSHRDVTNPLRNGEHLGASAAIEYAAQAMAAHGQLTATENTSPRQGVIAALRDIRFYIQSFETTGSVIDIEATRLIGDGDNVIYQFTVSDQGNPLVTGRATVILDQHKSLSL